MGHWPTNGITSDLRNARNLCHCALFSFRVMSGSRSSLSRSGIANMPCAIMVPTIPPTTCAAIYSAVSRGLNLRCKANTIETAETGYLPNPLLPKKPSKAVILKVGNDFRSSPNNGHVTTASARPFRSNNGPPGRLRVGRFCIVSHRGRCETSQAKRSASSACALEHKL
jgi:hypothetical protein